jgi:hypothetical protein
MEIYLHYPLMLLGVILMFFDVLLTMHLSIFILVINQLDAQNFCFTVSFISCLYMLRAPCAHHQEVRIVLYSLWYHHTYRCASSWLITKIRYRCASSWLITKINIGVMFRLGYNVTYSWFLDSLNNLCRKMLSRIF